MQYSAARWIQRHLINSGIVSNPDDDPQSAWPLYIDSLPDGEGIQDDAAAIYDTMGRMNGRYMRTGEVVEKPGIMIHVRGISRDDAFDRAHAIALELSQILRTPISIGDNSIVIQSVTRTGSILSLGAVPGPRPRTMFSLNAIVSFA